MTPTNALAWSIPIFMWLLVIGFNFSVLVLLKGTLGKANIKAALREKSLPISSQQPSPVLPILPAQAPQPQNGQNPQVGPDQNNAAGTTNDNTSYSRVTGMIGAVILVCFFWGVTNVLFVQMFENPDDISKILSGVGPFFLSGSALFAPYAFNQLSQAIKPTS